MWNIFSSLRIFWSQERGQLLDVQTFLDLQVFNLSEVKCSSKFTERFVFFPVFVVKKHSIGSEPDFYRRDVVKKAVDILFEVLHRLGEGRVFFVVERSVFQGDFESAKDPLERVFFSHLVNPPVLMHFHFRSMPKFTHKLDNSFNKVNCRMRIFQKAYHHLGQLLFYGGF
jgi:hypothetical protein